MKIWSVTTYAGKVETSLFANKKDAEAAFIEFVNGCGDESVVQKLGGDWWWTDDDASHSPRNKFFKTGVEAATDLLRHLNEEMAAMGEAPYVCSLQEHDVRVGMLRA